MHCFKLPKYIISDLYKLAANFLWGSEEDGKKTHWGSWDKLCTPKTKRSLGFRNLEWSNQALLAKTCWRVLRNPSALASRVLKASYFPDSSFLNASSTLYCASSLWRGLIWGRKILDRGTRWRVGKKMEIEARSKKWLPQTGDFYVRNKDLIPPGTRVADLALPYGNWNTDRLTSWFCPEDRSVIRRILGVSASSLDALCWHHSRDGEYSAKSGYWVASDTLDVVEPPAPETTQHWWAAIWKLHLPSKVRFFFWKTCRGWLPTMGTLARHGM